MAWTAPVLEGRIVRLEPLAPAHEEALWQASRDPATWEWLAVRQPETRAAWRRWVEDALAAPDVAFATVRRSDDLVVGSTRFLALRPEHASVEIGWTWLHPGVWGSGVNVEAKLLMLGHAFERWGCRRVELKTEARNARSRAAMERFGAVFEGVHRKHMLVRDGERRDSAWYSVVDDEWPAVRARLEQLLEGRAGTAVG